MNTEKIGLTLEDKNWRYSRVRKFIKDEGLDAILLSGNAWEESNIRYITGQYFRIGQRYAYVLFPADGEPEVFAFHPSRSYQLRAIEEFKDDIWFDGEHFHFPTFEEISSYIRKLGLENGKIGVDKVLMDAAKYEALLKVFPNAEFTDINEGFTALRRVKSPGELSLCKESARVCDEIWDSMRYFIKPGMYDYQITAEWCRIMYANKADKDFNLMQINPYDVSVPYWTSSHSPVRIDSNSMILMEITTCIGGYWTQRVGCASIGEPEPVMVDLYTATSTAQINSSKIVKPGINAKDVCLVMDETITKAGFLNSSDFNAGPHGHLMGLTMDEGTFSPQADLILEEGMVFVLHPSAAVPGFKLGEPGMFSPGNMYVVTKNGCEKLYGLDIELMIIGE
ncbi:MAG: hypothetical protein APF84_17405 [Gracilibacter sp. BRH_c7a]|nr:MAG: hypothetical protein APF84_17405 [Gracilibacter sp. BRH_c7a]